MTRFLAYALLFATLLVSGCVSTGEQRDTLRLYAFDCGRIAMDTVAAFGLDDTETSVRELVSPCYVVQNGDRYLLWDGGLPNGLAQDDGWVTVETFRLRLDRTLGTQLEALGLTLDDIDFAAFSHLHFDHVGVANLLETATLLIPEAEYNAAFAAEVTVPGFEPEHYQGLDRLPRRFIGDAYDVFGDGRVRIIAAPGHTPGHQVLLVNLERHGPVLLSGDLWHFVRSYREDRVPLFNVDPQMTRASMAKVRELMEQTGAELWIQHDLAGFARRREAPGFYD